MAIDLDLAPRIRLAVARLARRLRQVGGAGDLTPSMLSALASVELLEPVTIGELATRERVQPPSMTRIVTRLEEAGLIARTGDPSDRRVARLSLTSDGRRVLGRSRTRKDAYLAARLQVLSEAERMVLAQAAPILERLLEDEQERR